MLKNIGSIFGLLLNNQQSYPLLTLSVLTTRDGVNTDIAGAKTCLTRPRGQTFAIR
ncbi:MAG: hypothetical protein ACJA13_001797 [Paraglaciecola sp.]|jgi:hypothetical protein